MNATPYVVTTPEELDALPWGTLVLDGDGDVYRRVRREKRSDHWRALDASSGGSEQYEDSETVLWQSSDGPIATVVWFDAEVQA